MDKAKSIIDRKGSGSCRANGLEKEFHSRADTGGCNVYTSSGNCNGARSSMKHFHHLQTDHVEANGSSPAKRCRLRRRVDSVKRNRPRKCLTHTLTIGGGVVGATFACSHFCVYSSNDTIYVRQLHGGFSKPSSWTLNCYM